MLPFGAQGANQAIEDAGALGALFSVGNESANDVSNRLSLYEEVRRLRASRIQLLSRVRLGKEKEVEARVRQYADPPGSGMFDRVHIKFLLNNPTLVLIFVAILNPCTNPPVRCTNFFL